MELDQIRILNLLEEITKKNITSQRELSKKLNISLGLVNSFIKRLVKKGYFKVTTLPKNRLKYILTPKGMAEKTRLTYEYFHYSLEFYKNARRRILNVLEDLQRKDVNKVVIYGTGELAEILFILLQKTQLELTAVVDSKMNDKRFMGLNLMHPNEIASIQFDKILVSDLGHHQSIDQIAMDLKVPQCHLVAIQ